ncbi:MAG: hypothetical protein GXO27_05720 [Chlorobi bacterium]|nr:hypothetical protein [Chlorobiota bacterium]
MGDGLNRFFEDLNLDPEGEYYIDDDGRIMKKEIPFDRYTGLYIGRDGHIMREDLLTDQKTGYYFEPDGRLMKENLLFPEDTGVKIREDGVFMEKTFLGYVETPYYIDRERTIRKEGWFGKTDLATSDPLKSYIPRAHPGGEGEILTRAFVWLLVIVAALFVAAYLLAAFILLLPPAAFVFYRKTRKKFWLYTTLLLSAVYLTANISGGFPAQIMEQNFIRYLDFPDASVAILSLIYACCLIWSGVLWVDISRKF